MPQNMTIVIGRKALDGVVQIIEALTAEGLAWTTFLVYSFRVILGVLSPADLHLATMCRLWSAFDDPLLVGTLTAIIWIEPGSHRHPNKQNSRINNLH